MKAGDSLIFADSIEMIDDLIKENEFVLLFAADSACTTSRALDKKLEDFSKKNPQVKVVFTVLAALPMLASQYMIFVAPAIILFVDGQEVYREGRFVEFDILENYLIKE